MKLIFSFYVSLIDSFIVLLQGRHAVVCVCGGQKFECKSCYSPSILWDPGIKLRSFEIFNKYLCSFSLQDWLWFCLNSLPIMDIIQERRICNHYFPSRRTCIQDHWKIANVPKEETVWVLELFIKINYFIICFISEEKKRLLNFKIIR